MIRKRVQRLAVFILIGIAILIIRLVQIQLMETKSFSDRDINLIEASVAQRSQEMILDNGRGKFYDRNDKPLTYETVPSLVLFPFLKNMNWDVEQLANIIGVPTKEITAALETSKEPFVLGGKNPIQLTDEQMEAINELQIPGVFAVHKQFERKTTPAAQLIGILGENPEQLKERYPDKDIPLNTLIGITGLQKSFDEFLLQEENTKLVYHVDGKGGPLFGIDVKYVDPSNPFYPVKINTTIDMEIQNEAEKIADKHKISKGGIVLLDIETNSILALVSRPNIDEKDPYANDGAKNLMVTAQIPGSVFKTVIAAAAIDNSLNNPDRVFDCSKTIRGTEDKVYDHGPLNFTDSFAVSCNYTFGTLAQELMEKDETIIETYASKLGLMDNVGWSGDVFHFKDFHQLADEEKGQVFLTNEERSDANFVAQTGIGQYNVRITPLGAANMMATIARGGKKEMVRAVSSIEYKNGSTLYSFPQESLGGDEISPYTAMKLQQLLREVVVNENGTGRLMQNLPYDVAGKSGTAQTYQKEDMQYENKWFVGYFPFDKPKYAMAIVKLDVPSEEGSVTPIYQDMVNYLYQYDHQ
ncbi:penicillin-binding transpeptidase domain-containing protein [Caldibacillus lycopersici]|uniref:serine-type D-Ala-D-Ala carboxypeptidase n=1 Tax=Perspicuibacillus lycopersici TaxID=1325689 RepID=A0AAE3LNK3_9BACI|nr:penicillin-binding transpeptidase domain-containing protein [Perspicuibacillus lycopersici]MCU9613961.1 penicillin-binding transpeptidase domain-containing protein [Perspicuibacillus lycopersici]